LPRVGVVVTLCATYSKELPGLHLVAVYRLFIILTTSGNAGYTEDYVPPALMARE